MASGVAVYIVSLVVSFHLGIELRAIRAQVAERVRQTIQLEIALREQEADFAQRHADTLGRMEKISSVKYLAPESVAINR